MSNMWLFFTLLAALLWGIGQVFAKKGLSYATSLFNNLLAAVFTLLITAPFAFFMGAQLSDVSKLLPISIVIAVLLLSYYYVINKANISLVGTVLGAYPIFTVILSLIFLHEKPSIFQELAAGCVMLGTLLLIVGEDLTLARKLKFGTWVIWGAAGAAASGIADFLTKLALKIVDERAYSYIFTYAIALILVACVSFLFDKNGRKFPKINDKKLLPTLVGVTMIEVGMVAYFIALSLGIASVVTPVSSIYVAITAVLAWIFLKEKVNRLQIIGVLIACLGIILLGIQ